MTVRRQYPIIETTHSGATQIRTLPGEMPMFLIVGTGATIAATVIQTAYIPGQEQVTTAPALHPDVTIALMGITVITITGGPLTVLTTPTGGTHMHQGVSAYSTRFLPFILTLILADHITGIMMESIIALIIMFSV